MDLGTMDKKLNNSEYAHMSEFGADMLQIFKNARQFNPPGTTPAVYADLCEQAFAKEWLKALVPRLEYAEKRALQSVLTRLKQNPALSGLFLYPVDPIAMGIPHYHNVIPKDQARDLTLIENKLKNDKYTSVKAFADDVQLMIQNAKTFNAGDEGILGLVEAFEKFFKKELSSAKSSLNVTAGGTKRKVQGDGGSGSAAKKAKASM